MSKRQDARPVVVKDLIALESRFDGKLGTLESRLGGRMTAIETRLDGVEGRLDGVEGRLDGVEGRLDTVERKVDAVDQKVQAVDQKIDAVDRRLDRRIDDLKSQSQTQFEALRGDIRLLADHMVRVEGKLDRHIEQSTLEHAQIRTEIVAGDAALDRRVTRLERRMDERAG